MRQRGQVSSWLLAIGMATWLLAGLLPEGLRVCLQADGLLEVALGCPCDTCNAQHAGSSAVADCCFGPACHDGQRTSITAVAGPCCTCDELTILPGVNHQRSLDETPPPVMLGTAAVITPPCDHEPSRTAVRAYRAKAPPGAWSPDTIQLLI